MSRPGWTRLTGAGRGLSLLSGAAVILLLVARPVIGDDRLPNIVLVLADDLGWGSVGAYGAEPELVRTPNIDRIAAEGVMFRDASTPSSVCSPTRYSVLMGRYAWRTSLKAGTLGVRSPLHLEPERPTIAALLKEKGYATAIIGKWHLGYGSEPRLDYRSRLEPGPLERGFDYHFGLPSNHGDRTGVYVENHGVVGLRSDRLRPRERRGGNFKDQSYFGLSAPHRIDDEVTEVITDRAIEWMKQQSDQQPFFLLFSTVAVHRPISPSKKWAGTSAAGSYGDWIHELDDSIGRLLKALDDLNLAGDTLVVFTSDNGGVVEDNEKLAASEAARLGLRVNGPYRGGKRSIFEGGFRVPFVARWPGRIPAGSVRDEMVNLVDLYATLAAAVGFAAGDSAEDSVSFLPAMLGREDTPPPRATMVVHAGDGNYALRWGMWKWIEGELKPGIDRRVYGTRPEEHRPQLYNLLMDPGEQEDLISEHPEVARLMSRLLDRSRGARAPGGE